MDQPKAKKIVIEYEDGTTKFAEGQDAAKIMDHWNGLESLAFVHGMTYHGPCLKKMERPDREDQDPQSSHKA